MRSPIPELDRETIPTLIPSQLITTPSDVFPLRDDDPIENAMTMMEHRQVRRLPVLEQGKLVGGVSGSPSSAFGTLIDQGRRRTLAVSAPRRDALAYFVTFASSTITG